MGQAKRRGTYDERRERALKRNAHIANEIDKLGDEKAKAFYNKHSLQHTALMLASAGVMSR